MREVFSSASSFSHHNCISKSSSRISGAAVLLSVRNSVSFVMPIFLNAFVLFSPLLNSLQRVSVQPDQFFYIQGAIRVISVIYIDMLLNIYSV